MVLTDAHLRGLGAITPYEMGVKRPGVISYGESSAGYDIRIGRKFKIFTNARCRVIDPKNFDPLCFVDHEGDTAVIPPNSFALAYSVEHVAVPDDCIGLVLGKSTYARCGVCTNFTPLEPGWRGHVTIEISNTAPLPAIVYAMEGVAQILFLETKGRPLVTYADKGGKYQGQPAEVTLPVVD